MLAPQTGFRYVAEPAGKNSPPEPVRKSLPGGPRAHSAETAIAHVPTDCPDPPIDGSAAVRFGQT